MPITLLYKRLYINCNFYFGTGAASIFPSFWSGQFGVVHLSSTGGHCGAADLRALEDQVSHGHHLQRKHLRIRCLNSPALAKSKSAVFSIGNYGKKHKDIYQNVNELLSLQWNSDITNSVVYKHSVITNRFLSQIGYFSTQIKPVITNKNGRSQAVRYNWVSL